MLLTDWYTMIHAIKRISQNLDLFASTGTALDWTQHGDNFISE